MAKLHQVQLDTDGVTKVINQISLPESPYVVPSDATPLAPGTADPGLSADYSRGDHRHPMQVVSKGNITKGENGDITVTTVGLESKINVQFPEYVASDNAPLTVADAANAGSSKEYARADHQHPVSFEKGTVSNGTAANVSFTRDGNSVKLNMVDPAYAGHTDSESASNTMAATMPDGGIIIERTPGEKPVLKQKIGSTLEATKLGGTQATYTADSSETATILPDVEEGALIVEGTGPIVIDADVAVSAETGNTLERKTDGLFVPKSAVITANAGETDSILPSLAEGSLIVEGPGEIVIETDARVSSEIGNGIVKKADGIFVDSSQFGGAISSEANNAVVSKPDGIYVDSTTFGAKVTYGTSDPGAGSTLATGSLYLVYEE